MLNLQHGAQQISEGQRHQPLPAKSAGGTAGAQSAEGKGHPKRLCHSCHVRIRTPSTAIHPRIDGQHIRAVKYNNKKIHFAFSDLIYQK